MPTNWDKVLEEWRGRGTVQAKRIEKTKNGKWRLWFEENGKTESIIWKDRKELDRALIEFGGKNPETVSAPSKFLTLNGWKSADLFELGHKVTKIKLQGSYDIRNTRMPITLSDNCGFKEFMDAKRKKEDQRIKFNKKLIDREFVEFTACFKTDEQFDNFVDEVTTHPYLENFEFFVKRLVTTSLDTDKSCMWKRAKAGDGTKRMVLELTKLDGIHYNKCLFFELIEAADGMGETPCKKVPDTRAKPKTQLLCYFSAKERNL